MSFVDLQARHRQNVAERVALETLMAGLKQRMDDCTTGDKIDPAAEEGLRLQVEAVDILTTAVLFEAAAIDAIAAAATNHQEIQND